MIPGVTHLMGTLKSLARGLSHLDLSRTGITSRCLNKMADTVSESQILLASLQTLKVAENGQKGEDIAVGASFLSHSTASVFFQPHTPSRQFLPASPTCTCGTLCVTAKPFVRGPFLLSGLFCWELLNLR